MKSVWHVITPNPGEVAGVFFLTCCLTWGLEARALDEVR